MIGFGDDVFSWTLGMARRAGVRSNRPGLFNEQRQRFDWSLLQNGNVCRYDSRFQLDTACE
jgi:hypothetical protein